MKKKLRHMGLIALLLNAIYSPSYASIYYDLNNAQHAAIVGKSTISNTVLNIMHKVSIAKKPDLTRGDVLTALIENQLLGTYALNRFGKDKLLENNKVVFLPHVVLEHDFRAVIQVAFDKELAISRQKMGGSLDNTISQESPIQDKEWGSFLPPANVLQLNIQLTESGIKAAKNRVLLHYQFAPQQAGDITLWDVYQWQNVQGRNEIHRRNQAFIQAQARELVLQRFIDYWATTQSPLNTQDIADLKQALLYKHYHDGFVTLIGIAADIHDDVAYLKNLAKTVTNAEIKRYYQQHKEDFKRIARVKAQHITLSDEKTANTLFEQLKKGADFSQLAQTYSVASDKQSGGHLGWLVHDAKNPTWLNSLAFMQSPHVPSRPIRTPTGQWEILLISDKEEAYQPIDSESVRYVAAQTLARQKMIAEYQGIRKTLIKQNDIHINPSLKAQMLSLEKDVLIEKPKEEHHHHH